MLKQRIITAAILLPIVVGALLYLPSISLLVVSALVFLLAANELLHIIVPEATKLQRLVQYLQVLSIIIGIYFLHWFRLDKLVINLGAIVWLGLVYILWKKSEQLKTILSYPLIANIFGLCILSIAWLAFKAIYLEYGRRELLYLGCIVYGADIAAYFAGRKYGRHKLAPSISPGKTQEGVLGALGGVIVIAIIRQIIIKNSSNQPLIFTISLALIVTIISITGDLTESLIKRVYNVKDSSALLPGHGGILDRIDSLVSALPVYYCLCHVFLV